MFAKLGELPMGLNGHSEIFRTGLLRKQDISIHGLVLYSAMATPISVDVQEREICLMGIFKVIPAKYVANPSKHILRRKQNACSLQFLISFKKMLID